MYVIYLIMILIMVAMISQARLSILHLLIHMANIESVIAHHINYTDITHNVKVSLIIILIIGAMMVALV
jgi:hypothetical protein